MSWKIWTSGEGVNRDYFAQNLDNADNPIADTIKGPFPSRESLFACVEGLSEEDVKIDESNDSL